MRQIVSIISWLLPPICALNAPKPHSWWKTERLTGGVITKLSEDPSLGRCLQLCSRQSAGASHRQLLPEQE